MIMNDESTEHLNRDKPTWPLGKPAGRTQIACPPDVAEIRAALTERECTCQRGDNCFEIINKKGDAIEIQYGAPLQDWLDAVRQVAEYDSGTGLQPTADD